LAVRRKKNKKDKNLVIVNRFAICGKFTRALLAHQIFSNKARKFEIFLKFVFQYLSLYFPEIPNLSSVAIPPISNQVVVPENFNNGFQNTEI
jgi:hypothetical protein